MALNQEAFRSGVLGRNFSEMSGLGFMASPAPAYRDGSLGILSQPAEFRDGVLGGGSLGVLGEGDVAPAPTMVISPGPAGPPMWRSVAAMGLLGLGAWWLASRKKPLFAKNGRKSRRRR